jgi:hypothetical protein
MKKILLPALAILCAGVLSCRKSYNSDGSPELFPSTDSVFSKLALQPKIIIFDNAVGATFSGNSGTEYTFQPNGFVDAAGNTVTGNVTVEVTEFIEKDDMIFSGVLPTSDSGALISGGEINVNASQNGQPLQLQAGKPFSAAIPVKDEAAAGGMALFSGEENKSSKSDKVKWVIKKDASNNAIPINVYKYKLNLFSTSINYCNADKFTSWSANYQTFKIKIVAEGADLPSVDQLHTYVIFDNQKSVWKCGKSDAPVNGVYSENRVPDLPVHLASFAVINKKFYGGMTAITPKTGGNYTVTMKQCNATAFKAEMNKIP